MKCEHCGAEFEVEERITKITKRREIDSIVIDEKIQESLRFCSYDCQLQHQQYVCEHCHKNFTPKSLNQVFCSSECRILASNASKKKEPTDVLMCEVCGKEFTRNRTTGKKSKMCSDECRRLKYKNIYEERKKALVRSPTSCIHCGKQFAPNRKGQRFCCEECRREWHKSIRRKNPYVKTKICGVCGVEFAPAKNSGGSQKYCSVSCQNIARQRTKKGICLVCGKEYMGRSDNKGFCSRECARKGRSISVKNCLFCGKEFAGKGNYCSNECREKAKVKHKTCSVCGKEFTTTYRQSTCSDECRKQLARDKQHQIYLSKRDEEIRRLREEFVPQRVVCKECGCEFETEFNGSRGQTRTVFCSNECARRNHKRTGKAVRRARKKGLGCESFDPLDVLKRDNWTCQICGVKTPKKYRGTCDDRAPELDHIIPLALGGEHSMRNTQCLCRKCNGAKGATGQGQLRIA